MYRARVSVCQQPSTQATKLFKLGTRDRELNRYGREGRYVGMEMTSRNRTEKPSTCGVKERTFSPFGHCVLRVSTHRPFLTHPPPMGRHSPHAHCRVVHPRTIPPSAARKEKIKITDGP